MQKSPKPNKRHNVVGRSNKQQGASAGVETFFVKSVMISFYLLAFDEF